jgi:predicted transcriptional regulator
VKLSNPPAAEPSSLSLPFNEIRSFPNSQSISSDRNMASIIETLFGRAKTPAERLRQNQRTLQKAQRELDRERTKLEQQEKKLVMDIKKSAKDGQMVSRCDVMLYG